MAIDRDRRRYGVIEVHRLNAKTYHLTINGVMWSEVEWSASRRAWCIQDAAGQCLTHVEHIVGQDRDVETAVRFAKRMIVDGRMPAPEEAQQQLEERLRLGEPWQPQETAKAKPVPVDRSVMKLETEALSAKWN